MPYSTLADLYVESSRWTVRLPAQSLSASLPLLSHLHSKRPVFPTWSTLVIHHSPLHILALLFLHALFSFYFYPHARVRQVILSPFTANFTLRFNPDIEAIKVAPYQQPSNLSLLRNSDEPFKFLDCQFN